MLMEDQGSIFLGREYRVDLPTYVIRHVSEKGNISNLAYAALFEDTSRCHTVASSSSATSSIC